jgi:hypothetical protein
MYKEILIMEKPTTFAITTQNSSYMCKPIETFTYEITDVKTSKVIGQIVTGTNFISCTSNFSNAGLYMVIHADSNLKTEKEWLKYFKICVTAVEEYLKRIS